jgi:hypothetical protein
MKGGDLKELFLLFSIYMFFIVASLVVGAGVYLISPEYAYETTGALFILSTLSVVWQFFKEFGGK